MKFLWEKLYAKLNRIDNSSIVNHFFRNYFPRTMKNLYLRNPIKFTTNWKSSRIKSTRIKLSMENYSLVRSKLFSVLSLSPLIRNGISLGIIFDACLLLRTGDKTRKRKKDDKAGSN